MSKDHPIQVALNTAVTGKFHPEGSRTWAWYNKQFRAKDTTARGLAVAIFNGYAFTPVYRDNWRRKENFQAAWHIAFDFDSGDHKSSLDHLAQDWIYAEFGAFLYSTPSSTAEHPKSRMVFIFDEPITSLERYELLYRAMLSVRYPHADQSTKDGARLFFGSLKCELRPNWQLFTAEWQDSVIDAYQQVLAHEAASRPVVARMTIPPEKDNGVFGKIIAKILDNIRNAPAGQRHAVVVKNSFVVGGYVSGGYVGKLEAEAMLINAIGGMHPDADKTDLERVGLDSLEKGLGKPITISRTLDYIEDEG
jgi:hypothetical protein